MKAQEAILKIVKVFDEGNRQMEEILDVCGPHSLKAGELTDKVERSIMFRVAMIVRDYEKSLEPKDAAEPSEVKAQNGILKESIRPENHLAK